MPVELVAQAGVADLHSGLCETLDRAATYLLIALDRTQDHVELSLVDDASMRALNREYRSQDRPTDVLSFSQIEGTEVTAPDQTTHLGDIVISIDTAAVQAKTGGWSMAEECVRLLLHGLLHLLGYDHELGPEEAARMSQEESRLIAMLAEQGIACARDEAP